MSHQFEKCLPRSLQIPVAIPVFRHTLSVCVCVVGGGGVHTYVRLSVTECLKLVVLHEMKEKQKRHSRANYV